MNTTKWFLRAAIVGLLAREAFVFARRVPCGTVSESVWDWSRRYAVVPFAAGVLAGHLFWQAPSSAGAILGEGETEKDGK